MPLSFAQASFALAYSSGIARERADSFISRLKQWQKMGFPDDVNVGRGAKAEYGALQLYQLGFMLKLMQAGLPPQRAQAVVRATWSEMQDAILSATKALADGKDGAHYLVLRIDALSELQGADHLHTHAVTLTSEDLTNAFTEVPSEWSESERLYAESFDLFVKDNLAHAIVLEVESILVKLWTALVVSGVPRDIFAEEIATWVAAQKKELQNDTVEDEPTDTELYLAISRHNPSIRVDETALAMLSMVRSDDDDPQA